MKLDTLITEIARAYTSPKPGEEDTNGHTRLIILQERFSLSSLKLQKILVTAGVYEPVKSRTAYHTVTKLRKEGKSLGEIMKITGFSSATISACFPYEKSIYNADKNGCDCDVTSAAERKRRQRNREEGKRKNSLEMLQRHMKDEDFLNAVRDHESILFISLNHERFYMIVQFAARERLNESGKPRKHSLELTVHAGEKKTFVLLEKEVLAVFHKSLELLASGQGTEPAMFGDLTALPYIYPLLVVFGIISGDREDYSLRRKAPGVMACSCCGRRGLYRVHTYRDLVRVFREIENEEQKRWNLYGDMKSGSRVEKAFRDRWDQAALKDNAAIRAFDGEGERLLCAMCAWTIFMALEDGELPVSPNPEDYSMLSLEAAAAEYSRSIENFPERISYQDRFGRTYRAGMLEEEPDCTVYLHKARDKRGTVHTFACYMQSITDDYRIFEAFEIHRLTKAGKIAKDCTGTDYHFRTGLKERCLGESNEDRRRICIGFLELVCRIRDALTNPSLEWMEGSYTASDSISIGNRCCSLRTPGEIRIEYADVNEDEDEPLVQGRQWKGGRYGFMLDGLLFTGEEVAQMSGGYEGWTLQYRFADPAENPLRAGEYLMPVRIDDRLLVEEMCELLNLFTADGRFISDHDKKNFGILFEKTVLKKLKLYHESNPRGYGRLAAMHLIRRLRWVEDTALQEEQIRQTVRS